MTVTIELPPEIEARLRQRTEQSGQNVSGFVLDAIQEKISRVRTFDEVCAPFATAVAASGITDAEFDALVESARDEAWQARRERGT